MAESGNDVLKITDVMVKNFKQSARLDAEKTQKELINAKIELEKAGVPSANFVYERDFEGNITGNLLDKFNNGQWELDRDIFFAAVNKKFGTAKDGRPPQGTPQRRDWNRAVSYTHLTLPTIYSV